MGSTTTMTAILNLLATVFLLILGVILMILGDIGRFVYSVFLVAKETCRQIWGMFYHD